MEACRLQSTAGLKPLSGHERPVWLDPGRGRGLAVSRPQQADAGCAAPLSTPALTAAVNSAPRTLCPLSRLLSLFKAAVPKCCLRILVNMFSCCGNFAWEPWG